MKMIWKYELTTIDQQKIEVPIGAQMLAIQTQMNTPYLWALVNPHELEMVQYALITYGPEHPMPENPGRYLGTYQLNGSTQVFHVFHELTTPEAGGIT